MMSDGSDPREADVLAKTLANTKILEASVVIAGDDGIHWNSIRATVGVIRYLEANTPHSQGNFNFAASALVPSGTPFYPASYFTGQGKEFAIGLESANVVAVGIRLSQINRRSRKGPREIARISCATNRKNRASFGEGNQLGLRRNRPVAGPSTLERIFHRRRHRRLLARAYRLPAAHSPPPQSSRDALREIPVKHAGYSGLMLPVLEDSVLAQRWSEGQLTMDSLLAYSAVCGTGLDTIPLPGDVTDEQLTRILSDVASLSVKWHKPLSARLLPVAGKHAGDMTEFDDTFLVNAKLQPLP